ncbi:glycosyl transferase family 2 [Conchiformibius kuhniae]|uniref:Glycosyl transferase family 2 n=1 Tax=Conchiformibius kuhniae TaxID=211502 RepID=A0ABD8B8B2_9NEIS|nr:glycosyl transferase family 2 [Conchiformibius kuhniae]
MNAAHWAAQQERGHRLFLRLTAWLVRYLPVAAVRLCSALVCAYFYATSPAQRRHVRRYQTRLRACFPDTPLPRRFAAYRQFAAFGNALADRFAVWQHKIRYADLVLSDPDNLYADIRNRQARGQILLCSHLGNVEVCRALVGHHEGFKLNVLVYGQHAQMFNQALAQAGAGRIGVVDAGSLDTAAMLDLARRLDAGEWLAVAADRVPVRGSKSVRVPFLGREAAFPQGAWLLALLLKAPTNTVFVLKKQGRYHLMLRRFADTPACARHRRGETVAQLAQRYAGVLAEHAAQAPLQWFNFYDFWEEDDG